MLSSMDDRYIYCLSGTRVYVMDTQEDYKITQTLRRLTNSSMALSADGRYLGCIHPSGDSVEVCVYDIQENHREILRKRIRCGFSVHPPCFANDGRHILLCHGPVSKQLWRVDIFTGDSACIYKCDESHFIRDLDCNEYGILLSVCNGRSWQPLGYHVYFESVTSHPKIIDFHFEPGQEERLRGSYHTLVFRTKWLEGSKALVAYNASGFVTAFQQVDFRDLPYLIPAEDYRQPFQFVGLQLSKDKAYAASHAMTYNPAEYTVESWAYAFRVRDGKACFAQKKKYLWDVSLLNEHAGVLISGDDSEIKPLSKVE